MNVFDLVASLTLDTSGYDDGLSSAGNEAKSFGQKLGSGLKTAGKIGGVALAAVGTASIAVGKAMWNSTKELAEYGDNIDKMSQKMGISAQAYQEWDAVMQHSGTSIDSMQRGMTTLSKAAENNSDAFEKLGLTQEQVASMNQEELFAATIEGLQNMESGTERTVLAQELLGGSAKELGALLNTSAEDTQKMKDRVHELGGVMSDEAVKASAEFQDNLQDLQTAISGVKRGITMEFLPACNDMMAGFTMLVAGEDGAEEKIDEGMNKMVDAASSAISRLQEIGDVLFPKISEAITKLLPQIMSLGAQIVVKLAEGIVKSLPSIVGGLVGSLTGIIQTIATDLAPELPVIAVDLVTTLLDALIDNLDLIIEAGLQLVLGLVQGLMKAIPKLVDKIPTLIGKLVQAIIKAIPLIIKAGVELFVSLVKNIPAIISGIVAAIPLIIEAILDSIAELAPELASFFEGAWEMITAIWGGVVDFFSGIWEGIYDVFSVVVDFFGDIFSNAWDAITGVWDAVVGFFEGIWNGISNAFSAVVDFFKQIFENAWNGVKIIWDTVVGFFENVWNGIKLIFEVVADVIGGFFSAAWDAVVLVWDTVTGWFEGIVNGITGAFDGIVETIGGAFEKVYETIKKWIGMAASFVEGAARKIKNALSVHTDIAERIQANGGGSISVKTRAVGGVTEKGEIALLEGTGAEAVVPLDQNKKWIHALAMDMQEQGLVGAAGAGGDIIIPVYIGQSRIDELIVRSAQLSNYRSGGR